MRLRRIDQSWFRTFLRARRLRPLWIDSQPASPLLPLTISVLPTTVPVHYGHHKVKREGAKASYNSKCNSFHKFFFSRFSISRQLATWHVYFIHFFLALRSWMILKQTYSNCTWWYKMLRTRHFVSLKFCSPTFSFNLSYMCSTFCVNFNFFHCRVYHRMLPMVM